MQQKFLSNLVFLIALNLLVKPFWILGIDRAVQNEVGAEAYGSYFALFNLSLILNILLDLGITNFNNRNISQHSQLLGKYFYSIVALRLLLAVGYALVCLAVGLLLGYSSGQMAMLGVLCANQFLLTLVLFLRSNISGLQLFRLDSMLSVLDRLLMIGGCAGLLYGTYSDGGFTVWHFVLVQSLSYAVTAAVALGAVIRFGGAFRRRFDRKVFPIILRKSLPFALLILMMSIYGRLDSVLLERLLPDGDLQAGIYAQAFRLLDAAVMMGFLFAGLLLPMFSRMLKHREDVRPLAVLSAKLLLIPAFGLGLVGYLHSMPLMSLLYQSHPEESGNVLRIMLFSFLPMAGTYVFGTLLTANGNLRMLNGMAVAGVLTNVSMNLALIPVCGPVGSAIACLATQMLTFMLQLALAWRTFRFAPSLRGILAFALSGAAIAATAGLAVELPWMLSALSVLAVSGLATLLAIVPELGLMRKLRRQV